MRMLALVVTSVLALAHSGSSARADPEPDFSRHGSAIVIAQISDPEGWSPLDSSGVASLSRADYRARATRVREHAARLVAGCPSGQARVIRAIGLTPLVVLEVTPAGLECLRSRPDVGRLEPGGDELADADRGRLSALSSQDRTRIERSLASSGRARVTVQLRRVPVVAPERESESRELRTERRDDALVDRLRGGAATRERSLGADHQELVVDAAALDALLRDPEVVAIAARD